VFKASATRLTTVPDAGVDLAACSIKRAIARIARLTCEVNGSIGMHVPEAGAGIKGHEHKGLVFARRPLPSCRSHGAVYDFQFRSTRNVEHGKCFHQLGGLAARRESHQRLIAIPINYPGLSRQAGVSRRPPLGIVATTLWGFPGSSRSGEKASAKSIPP
jgi:hypothetical protein